MLQNLWANFVKLVAQAAGFTQQRAHHFYPGMLDRNSLVIDLGAHKGEFSRFITSAYGCAVLGLEANPQIYATLPTLPKTRFMNLAINRADAPVVFHVSENPEASSVYAEVAEAAGGLTSVSVEGITLDSLLKKGQITSVDLLKVDIESAEFQMLEAVSEQALSQITQITVEFHLSQSPSEFSAARVRAISQRLGRLGFWTFVLDRDHTDVLFLNPSRLPWRFTERTAMLVYRFVVMPVRRLIHRKKN